MSDVSEILDLLTAAAWRIRLRRAVAGSVRGALIALTILIPVLALRESVLPVSLGWNLLVLFVFLAGGALFGLLRHLPPLEVARQLDANLALAERLQSAVEFHDESSRSIVRSLIKDASTSAAAIKPAEALRIGPPREVRYLVPLVALAAVALWLPLPPSFFPAASDGPGAAEASKQTLPIKADAASRSEDTDEQTAEDVQEVARHQLWEDVRANYRDTPFATEPPDFASFLKGADASLSLLDPAVGLPPLERNNSHDPYSGLGPADIRGCQGGQSERPLAGRGKRGNLQP